MGQEWLKNTLILLPVFALMSGAGYYLWLDTKPSEVEDAQVEQAEVIGRLLEQTSNVKRKLGTSPYWNSLADKEALYSNDSIRTGSASTATILLNDKSSIELAENSLIVLEKSANQLNVDFKTGDIETKGGSENLSIKVKDTVLDAKSADLKLKTDNKNNTQIIVTKGSATLTDKQNKKTELETKKVVNVDEKGQAKQIAVALVLNTPKDKVVVLDPEKSIVYPFTWTVLDDELKEESLEISPKPDFSDNVFKKTGHQALSGNIRRGTQYWRVTWKTKDGKTLASDVRELKLEEDKRISNIEPPNNSISDFEPGESKISFSWSAIGVAKVFILEVAKDPTFNTMVITHTTPAKFYETEALKEGKYFWRVRAFAENNSDIGKSSPFVFTLSRSIPQIPHLVTPNNGFKWTLNDPLLFEWKIAEKATQYRWVVSRDSQQVSLVNQAVTKELKYLWKWQKPGDYYWSVTALNDNGEIVGKSVMHKVSINPTVVGPGIILKTPPDQEIVTRDRREPMDPVVFSWNVDRPIASGPFTFYISEKPDFSVALKKTNIESTRYSLRLEKGGNYYWKVEWINPADKDKEPEKMEKETSQAFVMKYRVNSNLLAPQLFEPLNNAKKSTPKSEIVEFSWNKVAGALLYRITIERENTNTKEHVPVVSQIVETETFTSGPLEPGKYYWSVSSLDKDRVEGPASQARSLTIELNKELSAPKLKAPVIK